MPSTVVQDVTGPWVPTAVTLTTSSVPGPGRGVAAVRFQATGGPPGEATATLATAVDLSSFEELRFWTRADRAGDGSDARPFLAELGYDDAADGPADDHHWLVPLGRPGRWEHHRIGLGGERRSAVTRLRLRLLTPLPLRLELAEVLAVTDAPTADAEAAVLDRLAATVRPPGPTAATVVATAAGGTTLVVEPAPFRAGNQVRVTDASAAPPAAPTDHRVTAVSHDTAPARTTLTIEPGVAGLLPIGSTVAVVAPVVVEAVLPGATGPAPADLPDPVVVVCLTDAREDLARGWSVPQRDTFRRRGPGVVCSVRPAPRPLLLEYQVVPLSSERSQALALHDDVRAGLGTQEPLRVGGVELPVASVPAPVRSERERVVLAPLVVQVGTRQETGARTEHGWSRTGRVLAAPLEDPTDVELVEVTLGGNP